MGMNDDTHPTPADELDDLAARTLDALDLDDESAVELHLLSAPRSAGWEAVLREAAGEYAAAGVAEVEPPPDLRDRILTAALAARPAGRHRDASDIDDLPSAHEVHRIEQQRALLYLGRLGPDDWRRPVDPPEFAGWTVHDVVAHLAANATLLAATLGLPVPGVPETEDGNEARTAAAQARHRALSPAVAIAEIDAAARAVDRAVAGLVNPGFGDPGPDRAPLEGDGLDEEISWLGVPMQIRWVLIVRAFETWTHLDDIRRALGEPMSPPPEGSLRTMSRAACGLLPLALAVNGEDRAGKVVRVRFTDVTDTWDVDLGDFSGAHLPGADPVDAELTIRALDLCRALGARFPDGGRDALDYTSSGDAELADALVDAVPALAVL
jgi:uncharacterized protein (TIGR03083 family)